MSIDLKAVTCFFQVDIILKCQELMVDQSTPSMSSPKKLLMERLTSEAPHSYYELMNEGSSNDRCSNPAIIVAQPIIHQHGIQ